MNSFVVSGRLMGDFKVNSVGDKKVAKATLAVDRRLSKNKRDEYKSKGYPTSDFPQLEIWGSEAKINLLTSNYAKGDEMVVEGYFQTGSYEKQDGTKIYTSVINVQDFDFKFKPKEDINDIDI